MHFTRIAHTLRDDTKLIYRSQEDVFCRQHIQRQAGALIYRTPAARWGLRENELDLEMIRN